MPIWCGVFEWHFRLNAVVVKVLAGMLASFADPQAPNAEAVKNNYILRK